MSQVVKSTEDKIADYINNNQNTYKASVDGGRIWIEKDGAKVRLYLPSKGYNGTYDITFSTYRHSEIVNRVTKGKLPYVNMKKFKDQVQYYIDQELTQQIMAPAKAKSQKNTEKTFKGWQQENAELLKHPSISEVMPKSNYDESEVIVVGVDQLVTRVNTYANRIPSPRQIMGIIIQSGVQDVDIRRDDIFITANGEETTKFLKLLNSPLEWVN